MKILKYIIGLFITLATTLANFTPLHAQQKGKASYYSKRANGSRTSSGVRLNNDSLVCAHRTHPFGTKLLVRNINNGKEVVVTVIDRGPHARGRIIDLSHEAARRLGMLAQGVCAVEVSVWHEFKGVPFKPVPIELPEIDFEVTVDDTLTINPAWKKKK